MSQIQRTLKIEGFPIRVALRSPSRERCSTATSGVYSATESECSNGTEQSMANTKYSKVQPSRGLPEAKRKTEKNLVDNLQRRDNPNSCKRLVSRIPPPKPLRYHIQNSSANIPYSRANSDSGQHTKTTIPKSRLLPNKKKAASYMNLHSKEDQILV